jgi:hypothetical protein
MSESAGESQGCGFDETWLDLDDIVPFIKMLN